MQEIAITPSTPADSMYTLCIRVACRGVYADVEIVDGGWCGGGVPCIDIPLGILVSYTITLRYLH